MAGCGSNNGIPCRSLQQLAFRSFLRLSLFQHQLTTIFREGKHVAFGNARSGSIDTCFLTR